MHHTQYITKRIRGNAKHSQIHKITKLRHVLLAGDFIITIKRKKQFKLDRLDYKRLKNSNR